MTIALLGLTWPSLGQFLLIVATLALILAIYFAVMWGSYWAQAYMSGADVSMKSLVVMSLLRINHRLIVDAKVMGKQSGLRIDTELGGMSTARLQSHVLAGGNVKRVVLAIIAAERAGMNLDFERAAAMDLAGRDVLYAVQTSISPRVITCPLPDSGIDRLTAVAKDGIELRISACVTVRTNLDRLIGGATEETMIARVGQVMLTAIGSAESHMDVLAMPSQISDYAMSHGLDADTAFNIVSIDIADIDIGNNIGARIRTETAAADTRIAQALAEGRRTAAIARIREMKAETAKHSATLVRTEAKVPLGLAAAVRDGTLEGETIGMPASEYFKSLGALPCTLVDNTLLQYTESESNAYVKPFPRPWADHSHAIGENGCTAG